MILSIDLKNRIIWSDSLVGQDTRFVILKPQFKSESDLNKNFNKIT